MLLSVSATSSWSPRFSSKHRQPQALEHFTAGDRNKRCAPLRGACWRLEISGPHPMLRKLADLVCDRMMCHGEGPVVLHLIRFFLKLWFTHR